LLDLTNAVPLVVIGASLAGSAHCAGMCGGLALSRSRTTLDQVLYHVGRLIGYLALGVAAGALGAKLFSPDMAVWFSWISAFLLSGVFILLGVRAWRGEASHFSWFPVRWTKRLYGRGGSFGVGLLTAALPCGWLQTFVLAAVATQSPFRGGALLLLFWTGTLPALVALPFVSRSAFGTYVRRMPRLTAVLLVLAGLGSFGMRIYHAPFRIPSSGEAVHRHCHE
jgi:hypothetical protein